MTAELISLKYKDKSFDIKALLCKFYLNVRGMNSKFIHSIFYSFTLPMFENYKI